LLIGRKFVPGIIGRTEQRRRSADVGFAIGGQEFCASLWIAGQQGSEETTQYYP